MDLNEFEFEGEDQYGEFEARLDTISRRTDQTSDFGETPPSGSEWTCISLAVPGTS